MTIYFCFVFMPAVQKSILYCNKDFKNNNKSSENYIPIKRI